MGTKKQAEDVSDEITNDEVDEALDAVKRYGLETAAQYGCVGGEHGFLVTVTHTYFVPQGTSGGQSGSTATSLVLLKEGRR